MGRGRVADVSEHCPFCGYPLRYGQRACPAHTDLPLHTDVDDPYVLSEDDAAMAEAHASRDSRGRVDRVYGILFGRADR